MTSRMCKQRGTTVCKRRRLQCRGNGVNRLLTSWLEVYTLMPYIFLKAQNKREKHVRRNSC